MIRKAQFNFICITMSILFVVFSAIFVITRLFTLDITERNIYQSLSSAKEDVFVHGNEAMIEDKILAFTTYNPHQEADMLDYFLYDSEVFDEQTAKSVIYSILSRNYPSGKLDDNIYYVRSEIDPASHRLLIIASDMTESINNFHQASSRTLLSLGIIYVALFYIVYRLSFIVFNPIKESFAKQKQFISNASHELKTPLSIISANADVLKEENDNEWLSNIRSQTDRMGVLVSDMLTLAKMDEGRVKFTSTEINLSEEIINATLPFDAVVFEKNKTLEIDVMENIHILAHAESVRQIVNILLDNAVKHASDNGKIIVSLKKESSRIALTVFNTGSLIPAEDSNKIFERFYRGDHSRSRESGGSGLGLAIARGIADTNKWKISAESVYDVSMTITVVFK